MGISDGQSFKLVVSEYIDNRDQPSPFQIGSIVSVDKVNDFVWINITDIRSDLHNDPDQRGVIMNIQTGKILEEGYVELMDEIGDWALYTDWDEWDKLINNTSPLDILSKNFYPKFDDPIFEMSTKKILSNPKIWKFRYFGQDTISGENTTIRVNYGLNDGIIYSWRYILENANGTLLNIFITRDTTTTRPTEEPFVTYIPFGQILSYTMIGIIIAIILYKNRKKSLS